MKPHWRAGWAAPLTIGLAFLASLAACTKDEHSAPPGVDAAATPANATATTATGVAVHALDACKGLEAKGLASACTTPPKLSVVGARGGAAEEADFEPGSALAGEGWKLAGSGTVTAFPTDETFAKALASSRVRDGAAMSVYRFGSAARRVTVHFVVVGTLPPEKQKELQAAVDGV